MGFTSQCQTWCDQFYSRLGLLPGRLKVVLGCRFNVMLVRGKSVAPFVAIVLRDGDEWTLLDLERVLHETHSTILVRIALLSGTTVTMYGKPVTIPPDKMWVRVVKRFLSIKTKAKQRLTAFAAACIGR